MADEETKIQVPELAGVSESVLNIGVINTLTPQLEVLQNGLIDSNEQILPPPVICGRCNKPKGEGENDCNCGRPVIYGDDILKKSDEYINSCQDEEVEQEKREGFVTYKIKAKLPTKGGLARYLGVNRDTLYEWAKLHPEFSDIMEQIGAEQEDRLINNGLSGDYNPTISKVLLTKHGYREGIEQTGDGGTPLNNNIADAINKVYGTASPVEPPKNS